MLYHFYFTDVDECLTNKHICHIDGSCNNTIGSYSCTCKVGYAGDGTNCTGWFYLLKITFDIHCVKTTIHTS